MDAAQFDFRGREVARRLRALLAERKLVERFVDGYAAAHGRAGLKASPLRYRELLITIGREAWLALAARVDALLPGKISRRKVPLLRGPEAEAAEAFRQALLDEVGKGLHWMPSDREEFAHDLILYAQIAARRPQWMRTRRSAVPAEGAFVDRCALLLDPSLLEKARLAAAKFLAELESLAEVTLTEVFRVRGKAKKA